MSHEKAGRIVGVVSLVLLCAAASAHAQNSSTATTNSTGPAPPGSTIGPPQLRDFQLEPKQRIVTQPAPQPQRPAETTARPAADSQRATPVQSPSPSQPRSQPVPQAPSPAQNTAPPQPETPEPSFAEPAPAPGSETAPIIAEPAPPAVQQVEEQGLSWSAYALPFVGILLVGAFLLRRRRRNAAESEETAETLVARAPEITPAPTERPWLELELKAGRASFTETEWVVEFELIVTNTGKAAARNLRIDVKMFNAGKEQDKEIGAFFRTAGRESTKLSLPGLPAGESGLIQGEVAMPISEMRGMKVSDRTVFIPVVAVNGLYDWDEGRSGQTAKSYVVGRELQEPSDKMGAFQVDLGPRIWRSVAQRPHKLARRF